MLPLLLFPINVKDLRGIYDFILNLQFSAICESCGCNLTAPSGWLTSPDADGDGSYENDLDCYWRIIADEGTLIEFKFLEMEIEHHGSCIYDFVQVRHYSH